MSNDWWQELDAAIAGRAWPILTFNTSDWVFDAADASPLRLVEAVAAHLAEAGYFPIRYSLSGGVEPLVPPRGVRSPAPRLPAGLDPTVLLPELTHLLRTDDSRVALVVDHADHVAPANATPGAVPHEDSIAVEILHGWGLDPAIGRAGNAVILISHQDQIHSLLRSGGSGYRIIPVPLPDEAARTRFLAYLDACRANGRTDLASCGPDASAAGLAKLGGGLRLNDYLETSRAAAADGHGLDHAAVRSRKAVTMRELGHDLVEVHDTEYGFDAVSGLPHAVDYLRSCAATHALPSALLLAGVPGTGKSFIVHALAHELGVPLLSMRTVHDRWVGASERNLERVLWMVENLAPCVVLVDEIDQHMPRRADHGSTDGGTSGRMLGRLWEFLGDTRRQRPILWVGTTNRPDLLDVATQDRFPVVVPFIHPSVPDVGEMLSVVATQQGRVLDRDVKPREIASLPTMSMATARTVHEIVATAARWNAHDRGNDAPIDHDHLSEAALDHLPNDDPRSQELLALTALSMTTSRHLLPWRHRAGVRPGVELPAYLTGLVDSDGELDPERLHEQLARLRSGG